MNDLKLRTKRFALDTIKFCSQLPNKPEFQVISRQLIRSATSVAANYRAVCRAKSKPDFINKLSIVEEEADESAFWLEMFAELRTGDKVELARLSDEVFQLTAIMVSSKKTARGN
jgi:four helix bundle protein